MDNFDYKISKLENSITDLQNKINSEKSALHNLIRYRNNPARPFLSEALGSVDVIVMMVLDYISLMFCDKCGTGAFVRCKECTKKIDKYITIGPIIVYGKNCNQEGGWLNAYSKYEEEAYYLWHVSRTAINIHVPYYTSYGPTICGMEYEQGSEIMPYREERWGDQPNICGKTINIKRVDNAECIKVLQWNTIESEEDYESRNFVIYDRIDGRFELSKFVDPNDQQMRWKSTLFHLVFGYDKIVFWPGTKLVRGHPRGQYSDYDCVFPPMGIPRPNRIKWHHYPN